MRYLLFILIPVLASAQPMLMSGKATLPIADSTATPPVFTPTNIVGYPSLAWYCPSTSYVTNGSAVVLTDLYTNAFDLTNSAAAGTRPVGTGTLNSLRTLKFTAGSSTYVRSAIYTSAQPHEVAMVLKSTHISGGKAIFAGFGAAGHQFGINGSFNLGVSTTYTNLLAEDAGSTNKWLVWNFVFNGTGTTMYTNSVAVKEPASIGTGAQNGFTLGANKDLAGFPTFEVAEIATYQTNLDATSRSNLFNYWTNKYALTP